MSEKEEETNANDQDSKDLSNQNRNKVRQVFSK